MRLSSSHTTVRAVWHTAVCKELTEKMGKDIFSCRNGEKSHYTPEARSAMVLPLIDVVVVHVKTKCMLAAIIFLHATDALQKKCAMNLSS